jgi:hypothetical protein
MSGLRGNGLNASIPQEVGTFPESNATEILINHSGVYYWKGNLNQSREKFEEYRLNIPNFIPR